MLELCNRGLKIKTATVLAPTDSRVAAATDSWPVVIYFSAAARDAVYIFFHHITDHRVPIEVDGARRRFLTNAC